METSMKTPRTLFSLTDIPPEVSCALLVAARFCQFDVAFPVWIRRLTGIKEIDPGVFDFYFEATDTPEDLPICITLITSEAGGGKLSGFIRAVEVEYLEPERGTFRPVRKRFMNLSQLRAFTAGINCLGLEGLLDPNFGLRQEPKKVRRASCDATRPSAAVPVQDPASEEAASRGQIPQTRSCQRKTRESARSKDFSTQPSSSLSTTPARSHGTHMWSGSAHLSVKAPKLEIFCPLGYTCNPTSTT